jgi:hypothetical protein
LNLAKALDKLGRYQEATPQFQEAIRLDPTRPAPHCLLGRTYEKLKRPEDSRRELELAQKLQTQKRAEEETLTRAVGTRGDPPRGLGLVPPPQKPPEP